MIKLHPYRQAVRVSNINLRELMRTERYNQQRQKMLYKQEYYKSIMNVCNTIIALVFVFLMGLDVFMMFRFMFVAN